jgi:hypothetical protein
MLLFITGPSWLLSVTESIDALAQIEGASCPNPNRFWFSVD